MRKLWRILALLIVLTVLLGSYFYLSKHPQGKEKAESAKEEQIEILNFDKTKLNKISITNEKGSFTLEKKEAKWSVNAKQGIKLDDISVLNIEDTLSALKADKLVEKSTPDLEQFGLKSPKATVEVFTEDGVSKTVYLGNKTVDGGGFYIKLKDTEEVYTAANLVGDYLTYGLNDIRSKQLTSINLQEIKYVKLANSKGQVVEINSNEQQSAQEKQIQLNNYVMIKPYAGKQGVDITKFSELAGNIQNLKIVEFVEDSAKDLAKYGLDKPSFELQVKDSSNELRLYFGKEEGNNIYFKASGVPEVYSMEKQRLQEINLTAFELLNKIAFLPFIETVDGITIEQNGKKDVIAMTREAGQTDAAYNLNDKEVDKEKFQKFYQELIGLTIDSENDKAVQSNAEIKIVYTLNTGADKTKTLNFTSYNQDFYALTMNGKAEFLVAKSKLQAVFAKLDLLR